MERLTEETTKLLSEEETARRLLIGRRRLQQLCREDRIEFVQVSPRVRGFRPEHVENYIRQKTYTPHKVDSHSGERVAFEPKLVTSEGGEEKTGVSVRTRLREEMRQWQ